MTKKKEKELFDSYKITATISVGEYENVKIEVTVPEPTKKRLEKAYDHMADLYQALSINSKKNRIAIEHSKKKPVDKPVETVENDLEVKGDKPVSVNYKKALNALDKSGNKTELDKVIIKIDQSTKLTATEKKDLKTYAKDVIPF